MSLPRAMRPGTVVVQIPTVAHLVDDGLSILRRELVKLRAASERAEELSEKQTKKLGRYVRALAQLATEQRSQAAGDIDELSDADVVAELLANPDMREIVAAQLRAIASADGRDDG